jgi:hypothetical protein
MGEMSGSSLVSRFCAVVVFLATASATQARAGRALSHNLDYYERPGWDPNTMVASGILCLTTGVGLAGSGQSGLGANIGHSALSLFELDEENARRTNPESYKVTSTGFWPEKGRDRDDPTAEETWQVENKAGDHFLTFSNSVLYGPQNGRHCVQVTKSEIERLHAFLAERKKKQWSFAYNCNDLSLDAFLGALFEGRSVKELRHDRSSDARFFLGPVMEIAGIMTPHVVLQGLRNFQKHYRVKGTLRYVPRDKAEIAKIQELQEGGRITVALFDDLPARAAVPMLKENPQIPRAVHRNTNR